MDKAFALLIYTAAIFAFAYMFARVCKKDWYPRRFPLAVGLFCALVIGGLSGFGMWYDATTVSYGVPE